MAHTAFILGRIEGPYKDEYASEQNLKVLSALSEDTDWPWLDGSMFSVQNDIRLVVCARN